MTTKHPQLQAQKRTVLGRKVKKIRKEGQLPANIYGKDIKSQALQINNKEFANIYKQIGSTGILELLLAGSQKPHPVLIVNIAKNPVTGDFLHVDFRQVNLLQKITANVPLQTVGEAPAEKTGGVLVQILQEVEVEALPADLPEKITIDVSGLTEINQSLTVANLVYDKSKITLKVDDGNALVVKIEPPAKEEVVQPKPAEGEEVKTEEGKTGEEKTQTQEKKETAKPAETPPEDKKE